MPGSSAFGFKVMDKPENPPAFPRSQHGHCGMSLKDWFAGQLATNKELNWFEVEATSKMLYDMAEAMLKEREKRND